MSHLLNIEHRNRMEERERQKIHHCKNMNLAGGRTKQRRSCYTMMMDDEGDDGADQPWLPPANNNRDRKTVNWRGNQVGEKEGIALRNLFDDLQNYFGQPQEDPKVTINIHLDRNSDDEGEIDAKADYLSVRKKGKLDFTYKISYKNRETSQKLEYMSMDICLDMTPKKKLNFGGHDMKDYCRTWAYASAPRYTIETFLRYFETGTGLNASSKGLILDENQTWCTLKRSYLLVHTLSLFFG